jgi:hypothetical protein
MGSLFVKLNPDAFSRSIKEAGGGLGSNDLIIHLYIDNVEGTEGFNDMDFGLDIIFPGFSGESDRLRSDAQRQIFERHFLGFEVVKE